MPAQTRCKPDKPFKTSGTSSFPWWLLQLLIYTYYRIFRLTLHEDDAQPWSLIQCACKWSQWVLFNPRFRHGSQVGRQFSLSLISCDCGCHGCGLERTVIFFYNCWVPVNLNHINILHGHKRCPITLPTPALTQSHAVSLPAMGNAIQLICFYRRKMKCTMKSRRRQAMLPRGRQLQGKAFP